MIGTRHTSSDCVFLGALIEACALGIYFWTGRINYPLIAIGLLFCVWGGVEAKWLSNRKERPAESNEVRRMKLRTLLISVMVVVIIFGLILWLNRPLLRRRDIQPLPRINGQTAVMTTIYFAIIDGANPHPHFAS